MLTINSWLYFYIYDYTQIYDHLGYLMIIVKKKKPTKTGQQQLQCLVMNKLFKIK